MTVQEKLNRQGQATIRGWQATVAQLWDKACKEDDIEPGSQFVVFSADNQYVPFYERAHRQLQESIAQYQAGGYVGLRIEAGKAR